MPAKKKYLVTPALPYANGPLHLGHAVEYVLCDVFVRYLRSAGHDVVFVCADDQHGTPVELSAAKQGMSPEAFVAGIWEQHRADFRDLGISLDTFHSTNSPENKHYSELIYSRLKEAGDILRRPVRQTYCEVDRRFLPDRFVRGTCPNCKSPDQYGDACEVCGKTYRPDELISPRCALCGTPPVTRESEHLFFALSRHQAWLQDLVRSRRFLHPAVANQLQAFFDQGLQDWDISRDAPYFGCPIPGEKDKFFYVWLDAPIGYISATEKWAQDTGRARSAMDLWAEESDTEIHHVIGKDIVYFHALFWPTVLKVARFKRPVQLHVHGHLTLNGEKMSKARGTMINIRTALEAFDPTYLRYFFAANLGPGPEDFDLSLPEFRARVNGELVNNFGNLANRTLSLLTGPLGGKLAPAPGEAGKSLVEAALARIPEVVSAYEALDFRAVVRTIVEVSQSANQFLQARAPWAKVKAEPEVARADLSDVSDVVALLATFLAPIVPSVTEKLFVQLGTPPLTFADLGAGRALLPRARALGTPAPLLPRLEEAQVNRLVPPEELARLAAASGKPAPAAPSPGAATAADAAAEEIDIETFARVDLRVGQVLGAARVPKADKLLKLTVDLGEGSPRTIVAGIAEAYGPEALVGRKVVVVANLKPRALRGIESRGMLLAAGTGGASLKLVDPGDLPPGSPVK
ncbi:MAG: methionine--tRNA ligase [Myxococcaceae bacterium]|nr:MAG: methionine--tRNA ligase [Myxococcaceae bacterium]